MKPYDIYTLENYPLEAQDKPEEFDEYVIRIDTCVPFHLFSRPFSGVYMIRSSCSFGNLADLQCHVSDKMKMLDKIMPYVPCRILGWKILCKVYINIYFGGQRLMQG